MQKSSISDGSGCSVGLLDYGARICNIDFHGTELALSYASINDYLHDRFYLGASIGPICGRTANGQAQFEDSSIVLPHNEGDHCLHSGDVGFDKHSWQIESHSPNQICYRLDFDMSKIGLSGVLFTRAIYRVCEGCLTIKYRYSCTASCFVNMTNHVYLNLSGVSSTPKTISDHEFEINADSYININDHKIPTGETTPIPEPFIYSINRSPYEEFNGACDHHFNLGDPSSNIVKPMLSATSKTSGIKLNVSGNSPGYQFYSANALTSPFAPSSAFCVETQFAPNALNHPHFYSPIMHANEQREQITLLQFELSSATN